MPVSLLECPCSELLSLLPPNWALWRYLGLGQDGLNRLLLGVVSVACRKGMVVGISSSSNASALSGSLVTPCCYPKQEGIYIKKKISPHLALQSFIMAIAQSCSPCCSQGWLGAGGGGKGAGAVQNQPLCRGGSRASPALLLGRTDPLPQGTLSHPCPALCQKFFQRIKGPSDSLLGTRVRPLHRRSSTVWPLRQTQ